MVLPVQHALQGHPESGRLWESHINSILQSAPFHFKSTTHDRNIYTATIEDEQVLLLKQVDDFALACSNEGLAQRLYERLGKSLQLPTEKQPPFKYLGLLTQFNGVDVHQYNDSIVISAESYLDRVMKSHKWTTPSDKPTTLPVPADTVNTAHLHTGFPEGTSEYAALANKHGFAYRTLLGELLYAYVTCRPDCGYSTVLLSRFATCPADQHYSLLRNVAKYLRDTKHWGITYRRSTTNTSLPPNPHPRLVLPDDLPPFPTPTNPTDLCCYVDAAHANDPHKRRSTTGYALLLAGGAISYRSKTQSITATSSTEGS